MIEFVRAWLLILIPLPVVAWWFLPHLPGSRVLTVPASIARALDSASIGSGVRVRRISPVILVAAVGWIALVVALAAPVQPLNNLSSPSGHDIIIAIDLSASMGETVSSERGDGTRADAVQSVIEKFVGDRKGDRIALVAFAEEAYLITPFSYDVDAISRVLDELTIGLPGRRTDIGQPIGLAVKLVREQASSASTMVLVTDGETNTGALAATDAAALAAKENITLHIIGFSATVKSENERYLRNVANAAGGRYAHAASEVELDQLYQELDRKELVRPDIHEQQTKRLERDLAWIPISLALLVLIYLVLLEARAA